MRKLALLAALPLLVGCSMNTNTPQLGFTEIDLTTVAQSPAPRPSQDVQDSEYAIDSRAEIEIEDQTGNGLSVMIEEIRVSREGAFLVVYDQTGLVLASVAVSPQSQPVTVALEQKLESSKELQAVLYEDNGDGVFDLNEDKPLIDYEGELVHEEFYYRVEQNG